MDEDELRGLMLAVEVPPSGADVRLAIDTGRRRKRARAVIAAGAAVVAIVGTFVAFSPQRAGPPVALEPPGSAAASQLPASGCVVTLLATPGGVTGMVETVDPGGTAVGGSLDGEPAKAALWRDGKLVDLPAGAAGTIVGVAGDTVVGYSATEADESTGWVWQGGKVTTLGKLAGYQWTNPNAVNAAGVVAGWVHDVGLDESAPVTWSADGTVHKLRLPDGVGIAGVSSATARDIADDGTVVGDVRGIPVVWAPDGTPRALPLPDGEQAGIAWAVAGRYAYGSAGGTAVRWDLTANTLTTLPGASDFGVRAGTADGTAVLTGDGRDKPSLRVRLDGGADKLLGPNGKMAMAMAISADGNTVAGVTLDGDHGRPVIWRCH